MVPEIAAHFSNLEKYIRRKKVTKQKNTNVNYIVTGVLIGLPMLVFSFVRPDYWIAKYNISQMGNEMSYGDVYYLCNLSSDAAPALTELYPEHRHSDEAAGGWEEYSGDGQYYYECPACKL